MRRPISIGALLYRVSHELTEKRSGNGEIIALDRRDSILGGDQTVANGS